VAVVCLSFGSIDGVRPMELALESGLGSRTPLLEWAMQCRGERVTANLRCSCEGYCLRYQAAVVPCWLGALRSKVARSRLGAKYLVVVVGWFREKVKMESPKMSESLTAECRSLDEVVVCLYCCRMNIQLLVDGGHAEGRWRNLDRQATVS
jgi:hypothetical protein